MRATILVGVFCTPIERSMTTLMDMKLCTKPNNTADERSLMTIPLSLAEQVLAIARSGQRSLITRALLLITRSRKLRAKRSSTRSTAYLISS